MSRDKTPNGGFSVDVREWSSAPHAGRVAIARLYRVSLPRVAITHALSLRMIDGGLHSLAAKQSLGFELVVALAQ